MYSYDEVFQATLAYFGGDELAAKVWVDKYALKNKSGELLEKTPDDMFLRLAKEFARIESKKFKKPLSEQEIYELLKGFKRIGCQGSPMYGIGNNYTVQSLGNCFTLGEHPYDSYGGILYADQMIIQLCKRRCGIGVCVDKIRPKGLPLNNAAVTTDGLEVFLNRFSNSIREVAQNGRRGAGLICLSVHHPEIEMFINVKRDLTKVTGANISVNVTDEFMQALENDDEYEQRWPVESTNPQIVKKVKARKIWDQIIDAAWTTAEPGVLFIDNARKYGLSHQYHIYDERFKDVTPNPCGEVWMGKDSCRLMVILASTYVRNKFTADAYFDFEAFKRDVILAQRLMDDMVDLEIEKIQRILDKIDSDPEPPHIKNTEKEMWQEYLEIAQLGRRTGLTVTGIGDMCAYMNLKYASEESLELIDKVYCSFAVNSMISSCLMAKELGPFPLYNKDVEQNSPLLHLLFSKSPELKELHDKFGRRNISLTTSSPCGTWGIVSQKTSAIEPAIYLEYIRRRKISGDSDIKPDFIDANGDKWEHNTVRHHGLTEWMEITGETDITKSPYYGATANDIDWVASVKLQGIAQKYISHSISKTCNLPKGIDKKTVSDIYIEAYKQKCKGFTCYVEGSRDGVLIKADDVQNTKTNRPKIVDSDIHNISVKGEKFCIVVGIIDGKPYEVFAFGSDKKVGHNHDKGQVKRVKSGHYQLIINEEVVIDSITGLCTPEQEALNRLASISLRHGVNIPFIVEQLERSGGDITNYCRGIARVLKQYIVDGTKVGEKCPECDGELIRESGCISCPSCGWSKC